MNGCGKFAIYPYLMTFTLLITFIFLNLFIGIILDGFGQADQQSSASFISEDEFSKIRLHWLKFDPEETYWIKVEQIKEFIQVRVRGKGEGGGRRVEGGG